MVCMSFKRRVINGARGYVVDLEINSGHEKFWSCLLVFEKDCLNWLPFWGHSPVISYSTDGQSK